MAVFNKEKTKSNAGRTTCDLNILTDIITIAVQDVEGVAPIASDKEGKLIQKIKLDFDGQNVFADLSISVLAGTVVPEVAFKVQESTKTAIESMTSFKVSSVDVRIVAVTSKEDLDNQAIKKDQKKSLEEGKKLEEAKKEEQKNA